MKFQGRFVDENGKEKSRWFEFPTEEAFKEHLTQRGWRVIEYVEIKNGFQSAKRIDLETAKRMQEQRLECAGLLAQWKKMISSEWFKKVLTNEWYKRFLLGASLILFAGIVFYLFAPKWRYLGANDLEFKYNSITGELWATTQTDLFNAEVTKIRFKESVKRRRSR